MISCKLRDALRFSVPRERSMGTLFLLRPGGYAAMLSGGAFYNGFLANDFSYTVHKIFNPIKFELDLMSTQQPSTMPSAAGGEVGTSSTAMDGVIGKKDLLVWASTVSCFTESSWFLFSNLFINRDRSTRSALLGLLLYSFTMSNAHSQSSERALTSILVF